MPLQDSFYVQDVLYTGDLLSYSGKVTALECDNFPVEVGIDTALYFVFLVITRRWQRFIVRFELNSFELPPRFFSATAYERFEYAFVTDLSGLRIPAPSKLRATIWSDGSRRIQRLGSQLTFLGSVYSASASRAT